VADLVLVVTIVAFFVLSAAYVSWCDRIIGADDPEPAAQPAVETAVGSATS
jgi:hypothetical protein